LSEEINSYSIRISKYVLLQEEVTEVFCSSKVTSSFERSRTVVFTTRMELFSNTVTISFSGRTLHLGVSYSTENMKKRENIL